MTPRRIPESIGWYAYHHIGLHYGLRSENIFHGDLRPANIIFSNGVIIIIDWEGSAIGGGFPSRCIQEFMPSSRMDSSAFSLDPFDEVYGIKDELETFVYMSFALESTEVVLPWKKTSEMLNVRELALTKDPNSVSYKLYALLKELGNVDGESLYEAFKVCLESLGSDGSE